ncbi:YhfG family protein [Collimonas fungivorans]|uniref:YhfG family protein n=1 Tax=Collimonas fungivorans TaxID=158899 RepID=UPI000B31EFAF
MLTNEVKRQVFLKLRSENYRASLRLEGLVQRPVGVNKPAVGATTAALKTKNVR